ncbi:MAG: restriction endonuclease subunit S, partial [Wujia sp.]
MKVDKTKWITKPIRSLFDLQMGKTPSRKSLELWENGNTPWVSISDMNGIKYISSTKEMLPLATIIQCNIPVIPAGIVIMSFKLTIGKTCIANVPLTTNEAIMAFYPKKEVQIDNSFLCYALSAIKWKGNRAVKGLTINKKTISQKEMSLPCLTEQQAIASELDAIQTMIDGYKAQLEDLDALAQSIFLDMFGDPITNPKEWVIDKLGNHIKVIGGYAFKSGSFLESGIPVLRIGNINSGVFKKDNLVFWQEDNKLLRYKIYPGDLVISLTGTVGKSDYANVCILDRSYPMYYLNQRNAKLELSNDIGKSYLTWLLKHKHIKNKLTKISRGI